MTNNLFWCIASNGSLIANTAMSRTVNIDRTTIACLNGFFPNRCAKGKKNEKIIKLGAETIVAMTLSAGASAPIRPVYRLKRAVSSYSQQNIERIHTKGTKNSTTASINNGPVKSEGADPIAYVTNEISLFLEENNGFITIATNN